MATIIATSNSGKYQEPRTIRDGMPLAYIYMVLKSYADAERIARGNPAYPVTVRAWRVTDAGTHIFPPLAEMSV